MNTEKEKNVVVLNTPKNLNLQAELNKLANNSDYYKPLEDSRANYNKLVFLIHQINYWTKVDNVKKGYELNNQNHYQMMGLSPNYLKMLIDALIALGLIKLINKASKNRKTSNCYAYISPFDINDDNLVNKHFFNVEEDKCPKFIKKWVRDGNKVLGKDRSSYKESTVKVVKKSTPNAEVEALKLEVERLKELLKLNNIQFDKISPLEPSKEKDEVVVEEDEKLAVKPDNELLELNDDGSFEIILKSKNYYFQNFNKVKQLANDEDEVYGFAQRFMMQSSPVGKVTIKDKVFGYQWAKEENDMMILID